MDLKYLANSINSSCILFTSFWTSSLNTSGSMENGAYTYSDLNNHMIWIVLMLFTRGLHTRSENIEPLLQLILKGLLIYDEWICLHGNHLNIIATTTYDPFNHQHITPLNKNPQLYCKFWIYWEGVNTKFTIWQQLQPPHDTVTWPPPPQ